MDDRITRRQWTESGLLALVALAFLVLVVATRPDEPTGFPGAVQDGLALLLTSLVVVLGFARETYRRTVDATVEQFRAQHDAQLSAWVGGESSAGTTAQVEAAMCRAWDANNLDSAGRRSGREARRLRMLSRRAEDIEHERDELLWALTYRKGVLEQAAQAQVDDAHEIPDFFRQDADTRTRFESELQAMQKELDRLDPLWHELRSERGGSSLAMVSGPALVRLVSTSASIALNSRRFVAVLLLLYVAGCVHGGPPSGLLDDAQWWVATVVVVLATAITKVATDDLKDDLRDASAALSNLPLIMLSRLSAALAQVSPVSEDEGVARAVRVWHSTGRLAHRRASVNAPDLPWADAVAGQFELAVLQQQSRASVRGQRSTATLARVVRLLSRCDDYPIALVALARAREMQGGEVKAVRQLVERALDDLDNAAARRPDPSGVVVMDVPTLLSMLRYQWPHDAVARERLEAACRRHRA